MTDDYSYDDKRNVPSMSRNQIGEYISKHNYRSVGRKYLNSHVLKKMLELEYLGGDIGDIYMNPRKAILFRVFISKPMWYKTINNTVRLWVKEREVSWIGNN